METKSHNDPLVHSQLSHFSILAKIGEGGMGCVYKAVDVRLQRHVAIKLLSPALIQDQKALKRFQIEAVAASTINHPNICTIYEIDKVNSHRFIAMEYIEGLTVRQLLELHGLFKDWDVIWIMEQVCSALGVAHAAGIVHLDIKPDNIMICREPQLVKITDFGLARLASETAEYNVDFKDVSAKGKEHDTPAFKPDLVTTTFSNIMGTAAYMSPEQVKRETIDFRSDIWSLGVLMVELLTGKKPFRGDSQVEVLEKIAGADYDHIATNLATLPHKWQPIVKSCLRNSPAQRYQSVNELARDIDALKKSVHKRGHLAPDEQKVPRKHRRIVLAVILPLVLLLLITAGITSSRQWLRYFSRSEFSTVPIDSPPVTTTSLQAFHYFLQGREAWWRYDGSGAIQRLQMAVEADSTFAYAQCLLGVLLHWRARGGDAQKCFLAAAQQQSRLKGWEKLLVSGFTAYFDADYTKMLQSFDELVVDYPEVIDGYLGAALACEELEDFDKAIQYTRKVIEIDSTHIAAHGNIADMFENKGDLNNAVTYSRKYLQLILDSGNLAGAAGAHEQVGKHCHLLAQSEEAILHLEKSLELDPSNKDVSRILLEAYALQGRLTEAENTIKSALKLPLKNQERETIYVAYAKLMLFSGRYVDALAHLQKAKKLAAERGALGNFLGNSKSIFEIYLAMGQSQLAQIEVKTILDSSAKLVEKDRLRSWGYYVAFQWALSRQNFDEAQYYLNLHNKVVKQKIHLGYQAQIALAKGEKLEAEKLLLQDIKTATKPFWGEKLESNYYLARLYYEQHQYDKAIVYCQTALQTRHFLIASVIVYCQAIALLSEIYEKMGELENALSWCDRFLLYWRDADPGIPLLVQVQERKKRLLEQVNPPPNV
ncbi:serine/threonine-protein kinase [candidate division KSB1 bacterium]|nr:protein kinase [candidate division KSB1 bacterium]RQW00370.1 MAG: serine/threonine-protein kinase [candidate division KSB1 bacterium]